MKHSESGKRPAPSSKSVFGRIKASYPRIRHLLVPLDFSGKSRQALRYAVPLAQRFSAQIILLHVLATGRGEAARSSADAPGGRRVAALKRLQHTAAQLIPSSIKTHFALLSGEPARQILIAVERFDADLIVLTTKGQTGLRRMLVGSTAETVMRHAPCPVLSVRRQ